MKFLPHFAEFKGPDEAPYGDVDVVVGVSTPSRMDELGRGLARELGDRQGAWCIGSGRIRSVLTNEKYQVDLRFCFEDECDFLVASKANNDFAGIMGEGKSFHRQ